MQVHIKMELSRQVKVAVSNPFTSLPNLKNPVKLLDDKLDFSDALQEFLLDQPDFLVVSVVGLQGTGKSTILSALAKEYSSPNEVFPRSSKEQILMSEAATLGIDVYMNSNRVIYLDCQPLLSASIANKEINNPTDLFKDNYITYEAPSVETSMEIKALQLLAFLMCISHHMVLVQDWILDSNLLRLLCTAEMLKPTIPGYDDQYDHYPNVILVHNKVLEDEADPSNVTLLQDTYTKCFQSTRLSFSNTSGFFEARGSDASVNLVLLPSFDTPSALNDFAPFAFLGTFDEEIRKLREQLFCLPRDGLALNALTEKNWYC
nr:EOG090X0EPT [Triops cancriformis]